MSASSSAQVKSVDAIRAFRVSLIKFREQAELALNAAEQEVRRTNLWLQNDRAPYWKAQIRKLQEAVTQAKRELSEKENYRSPSGGARSTHEERKALAAAQRRLEEAELKLIAVRGWSSRITKLLEEYRGAIAPMRRQVEDEVPGAVHLLDRLTSLLQAYLQVEMAVGRSESSGARGGSISRGEGETVAAFDASPSTTPPIGDARADTPRAPLADWLTTLKLDNEATAPAEAAPLDEPDHGALVLIGDTRDPVHAVYLERVELDDKRDSGWTIQPTDAVTGYSASQVDAVVAAVPALARLLAMPAPYRCMLVAGVVWQLPNEPKGLT